jgi:hypothetical protein
MYDGNDGNLGFHLSAYCCIPLQPLRPVRVLSIVKRVSETCVSPSGCDEAALQYNFLSFSVLCQQKNKILVLKLKVIKYIVHHKWK